jgi:hypothetical protein
MFTQLKFYLDYCLRAAQNPCNDGKTFFDQAFGAIQYQAYLDVDSSPELADLWAEYKPKFEKAVYGI